MGGRILTGRGESGVSHACEFAAWAANTSYWNGLELDDHACQTGGRCTTCSGARVRKTGET